MLIWFDLVWAILIWSWMILMWFGLALGGFDVVLIDVGVVLNVILIIRLMLIWNATLFKFNEFGEHFLVTWGLCWLYLKQFWAPRATLGANLGSWAHNDPSWTHFWSILGPLWTQTWSQDKPTWANLEPTWAILGQLGANLEPTWCQLGTKMGQLGANLGQVETTWSPLGPR